MVCLLGFLYFCFTLKKPYSKNSKPKQDTRVPCRPPEGHNEEPDDEVTNEKVKNIFETESNSLALEGSAILL